MSKEWRHSGSIDLTFVIYIIVSPWFIKVLVQILLCCISFKAHMSWKHFLCLLSSLRFCHEEITCLLTCWRCSLGWVFHDGRVHKLVIIWSRSLKVVGCDSLVSSKAFFSNESIHVRCKSWMWMIFIPFGSNWYFIPVVWRCICSFLSHSLSMVVSMSTWSSYEGQ